jgi:hypothetical protein
VRATCLPNLSFLFNHHHNIGLCKDYKLWTSSNKLFQGTVQVGWSSFFLVIFKSVRVCVCVCVRGCVRVTYFPLEKSINIDLSCNSAQKLISSNLQSSFLTASFQMSAIKGFSLWIRWISSFSPDGRHCSLREVTTCGLIGRSNSR